ncbi:hypothetical protein ACLXAZ_33275, partial [Escherichia coli]
EEIGGKSSNNSKWREVSWTGTLGYSDRVANTSWEYELAATRSEYRSDRTTRYTPAAGILDLYLGRGDRRQEQQQQQVARGVLDRHPRLQRPRRQYFL